MSETLSRNPDELGKNITVAGSELADQLRTDKDYNDLYDETGALSVDGEIARAAVNRVDNPDFRTEEEKGLLSALNAQRVMDTDLARKAAEAERPYRESASALDKIALGKPWLGEESDPYFESARRKALYEKRKEFDDSASMLGRIASRVTNMPTPGDKLTIDDVSDRETRRSLERAAKKERVKANQASDEVISTGGILEASDLTHKK